MHEYQVGEHPVIPEKPDPKVGMGERKAGKQSLIDAATNDWAGVEEENPDKATQD